MNNQAKAQLSSYLKTEKIILSSTRKKVGAMIYNTAQVKDLQHLTTLVEAVGLTVSEFEESFDARTGKKRARSIYLGPPNSANVLEADDFVASI
tara:strand:+ start:253 stop:534 length:282 start_codon:yes stop_codon:yes gene_type:complete